MLKFSIKGENECAVVGYEGDATTVSIPDSVEFEGRKYCVTEVEAEAFDMCKHVTCIEVPASVKKIGNSAFIFCSSLEKVKLNDGLEEIDRFAFSFCENLTEVIIPQSTKLIGDGVFRECRKLVKVRLPDGLTKIGRDSFSCCLSLSDINFPESLTHIGADAFCLCQMLPDPHLHSLEEIGDSAFYGCKLFEPRILFYANNTKCYGWVGDPNKCTEVEIPATVTHINSLAFCNCRKVKSVVLPEGITEIGQYTFASCNGLTEVRLPSTLKTIGYEAFGYCISLTKIKIPDGVTEVADTAFQGCKRLVDVEMSPYAVFGVKLFGKAPFAIKYKRVIELNSLLVKTLAKDLFKKNKLKGFKVTGVGMHSVRLTLSIGKTEYWSGCLLIEDLPSKVEFLKQKLEEARKAVPDAPASLS